MQRRKNTHGLCPYFMVTLQYIAKTQREEKMLEENYSSETDCVSDTDSSVYH